MAHQLQEINQRIRTDVKGFLEECDQEYAGKVALAADNIIQNMSRSPVVLLSGPSGSGKTTLMNILGCRDRPTCGSYPREGKPMGDLGSRAAARARKALELNWISDVMTELPADADVIRKAKAEIAQLIQEFKKVEKK